MLLEDERLAVRKAFSEAAEHYDAAAHIQREIATHLASMSKLDHDPEFILDAGCGTGHGGQLLCATYKRSRIISLDSAHAMCRQVPRDVLCADIERLPLTPACIDLYWSSLAWQWTSAEQAIQEAARVLKSGASIQVATLGPDTLWELRLAFRAVDDKAHVRSFENVDRYADLFAASGLKLHRLERRQHVYNSPQLSDVLASIRRIGAHTLERKRKSGLMGRGAWARFCAAYESLRTEAGLPATYDAVYLNATKD